MLTYIILASLAVALVSLSGVISTWKSVGKLIQTNLSLLVSFSSGVFLVVTFLLIKEVIHLSPSLSAILLSVSGGILLVAILFKVLPHFHHHHDSEHEKQPHHHLEIKNILIGDALHNLGDGVLIAVAFMADPALGIITSIGVIIHEVVQEISEFFVLKEAGYSTRKALLINFLISLTILIGALGSYWLIELVAELEYIVLGISAGAFLVVVAHDLIPHSIRKSRKSGNYLQYFSFFLLGIVIMYGVSFLSPHSHEEKHDHHEENDSHEKLQTNVIEHDETHHGVHDEDH